MTTSFLNYKKLLKKIIQNIFQYIFEKKRKNCGKFSAYVCQEKTVLKKYNAFSNNECCALIE